MSKSVAKRVGERKEKLWALGLPIGVFLVFSIVWQLATIHSQSLVIPTFTETMAGLYRLVYVRGDLWMALYQSNQALVLGYLISVAIGLPLGLAMARADWLENIAEPYTHMLLATPTAPLIPLIMMALGLGLASRVMIVVLFSFIYITINTRAGVRNVDSSLIEMAKSFGANEAQIWQRILIPGAVPAILTGLRIGLGRAINGMVAAELLLVASGIGNLLLEFRAAFEGGLVFATVFVVALQAVVLLAFMQMLEQRLAPGRMVNNKSTTVGWAASSE
ncbi:MAG TPA: ABC transporter permease [Candidatus Binatia bacterium]|nr:ABC transporter permease [Candidatus Binatia bacterium]